jgi:DNA-binding SARP family transcriptional activator
MDPAEAAAFTASNKIRFYLLGSPQILYNESPAAIDRHKATALLAYLCMSGRTQHRDKLANLLWPDYDRTRGRAALRRVLATLTRALPAACWETDRDTITLLLDNTDHFWSDVHEFRRLLAAAASPTQAGELHCPDESLQRLAQAVALFQGDFLEGFSLKDSAEFDDWQMNQGETLRLELAGAVQQLIECHEQRGEYETAVQFGRRWIQLDLLEEKAHEKLMRLYIALGRNNAAMQQYQTYRRILECELGVPPEEEITQLYASIAGRWETRSTLQPDRKNKKSLVAYPEAATLGMASNKAVEVFTPAPQSEGPSQRALARRHRTFGRERELGQAHALWGQVQDSGAAMLLLSGEPGIGKSHLARVFLEQLTQSDAIILRGESHPNVGPPYAPVAQVITECLRQPELEEIALQLPFYVLADLSLIAPHVREMLPAVLSNPRLGPLYEQQRIFDSFFIFCELLIHSHQRALLLMFEDMHWADLDSLQLLQYLVRRANSARLPLLVAITFRDTETDLATSSVLQEMASGSSLQHPFAHIQLSGIDRQQTRDFVINMLVNEGENGEAGPAAGVAGMIYEQSEGNPYFIEELCRYFFEEGWVYEIRPPRGWPGETTVPVPATIRELILSRVRRLSAPCRQILQQGAFFGRQFNVDALRELTGLQQETLIDLLEEAIRAHLILETSAAGKIMLSFSHQLIPFALRESASGLRRRREHQRIADYLEAHDPADLDGLAYHNAVAGNQVKAIQFAQVAARQAMSVYAFESALQQLRGILDLVPGIRLPQLHLSVLEDLADVYRLMGKNIEAVTVYQEALTVWHVLPQKDLWIAVRLDRKIGETVASINQFTDGLRLSVVARACLESGLLLADGEAEHPETVRLLAALSRNIWYMQPNVDWDVAERYARSAVAIAEVLGGPVELSRALESLANVYGAKGQMRERVEVCLRRLDLSHEPQFNDLKELTYILLQTGMAHYDVGEYVQALGYLAQAESLGRQIRDISVQADALVRQGSCMFRLDRWDDMLAITSKVRQLEADFTLKRMGVLTCFFYALQANVQFLRGEIPAAETLTSEAYHIMVSVAGPPERWVRNQHF